MIRRFLCWVVGHRRGSVIYYKRLSGPSPWGDSKIQSCVCSRCGGAYIEFVYWETK